MNVSINYNNEKIKERLTKLLITPKGTMPFARDYGVDYSAVDMPTIAAENSYSVAMMEAVDDYENEVTVDSVEFTNDNNFNPLALVHLIEKEETEDSINELDEEVDYEW